MMSKTRFALGTGKHPKEAMLTAMAVARAVKSVLVVPHR